MSVGQNIRKLREAKGLKQNELAEKLGIGRSYLSRIERGSSVVHLELAGDIAKELECTIYDIIATEV